MAQPEAGVNSLVGTFWYLIWRRLRNRVTTMARRVRQPKYAIGLIVAVLYLGLLAFGGMGGRSTRAGALQNDSVRAVAPLILLVLLASSWFTGGARSPLAYSQAEVSLLFTAPLSRRGLILYKLANAQTPIIINALIFAFIFGRGPAAIPRWVAVASLYTMFATLYLHRLGAALVRASTSAHGLVGARRNWLSQLLGLAIIAVIGISIGKNQAALDGASTPFDFLDRFANLLSLPAVRAALYPFSIIVAPAFARSFGEWAMAMGPALGMLLIHLVWVLRTHTAFEEAAAEVSAKRQQMVDAIRSRGVRSANVQAPTATRTLAIGSTGHPALAIVWKNMLCFMRTVHLQQFIALLMSPILVGVIAGSRTHDPAALVAIIAGMVAVMLLLTGGAIARNDLRGDLVNLPLLKTLPLRGRDLLLAEVVSLALPMAAIQTICLGIALVALQFSRHPLAPGLAIAIGVSLPFTAAGLNLCTATIQNGIAVAFPGWTRGGAGAAQGIEVIGPALLGTLAMFVTLLLCLILPAVVAFVVFAMVKPPAVVAVPFVMIVGSIAVAAEAYGLTLRFGRSLEKMEPSHVG